MKATITASLISFAVASAAYGRGLYYIPNDTEQSVPISWSVGVNAIWDSNTTPTNPGPEQESFAINPYAGTSFVRVTPQTTLDVYARLGVIYYFDQPDGLPNDLNPASRVGVNLTHRINERLRYVSRNFVSYELEPDYAFGVASDRQAGDYLFWETDNAIGYRWTERLATYTGFTLTGLNYSDNDNSDRYTWALYNQFRYQLTPQTVGTVDYRYAETAAGGVARDSGNQYLTVGFEHRFDPTTILVVSAGAQFSDGDDGFSTNGTNPYLMMTMQRQVNQQFSISAFLRYSSEVYDTVKLEGSELIQYSDPTTLRAGVTGSYQISPALSIFGGLDVISTSFDNGFNTKGGGGFFRDADEKIFNLSIGATMKLTDYLYGSVSYNYTKSDSDFFLQTYDRNRVSVGLSAEF